MLGQYRNLFEHIGQMFYLLGQALCSLIFLFQSGHTGFQFGHFSLCLCQAVSECFNRFELCRTLLLHLLKLCGTLVQLASRCLRFGLCFTLLLRDDFEHLG